VGAQDSEICDANFPKRTKSDAEFVLNTSYGYYIVIDVNSTYGARHSALHPAGIALL